MSALKFIIKKIAFIFIFFFAFHLSFCFASSSISIENNCKDIFSNTTTQEEKSKEVALVSIKTSASEIKKDLGFYHSIKPPTFSSVKDEIDGISNHWGKTFIAPQAMQNMLPEGIFFINHIQNGSDGTGIVKRESGDWISLRYSHSDPLKSTNLGLSAKNIVDWAGEDKKYITRKDSKAVMLWLHGGGTRTTGYQTGSVLTNMLDSYGIDVISFSLPWHDEGPRHIFRNVDEFSDWLLELIKTHIPTDKPVLISGHSMGGLLSDLMMRRSGDPNFSLGQRVSGFISMAPVADMAPGKSRKKKLRLNQNFKDKIKNLYQDMSPSDKRILETLAREGKTAHLTFLFVNLMLFDQDWTLPKDLGENLKPNLAIVGKGDGVTYTGLENFFETYLKPLINVDFKIIQPSINKQGQIENHAGHVEILDKRTPLSTNSNSKTGYEVHDLILDFISKVTGQVIEEETKKVQASKEASRKGTLTSFLSQYSNNLVFRQSLDQPVDIKKTPLESFLKISQLHKDVKLAVQGKIDIQKVLNKIHSEPIRFLLSYLNLKVNSPDETSFQIPETYLEDSEKQLIKKELKALNSKLGSFIKEVSNFQYIPDPESPMMQQILEHSKKALDETPWSRDQIETLVKQIKDSNLENKNLIEERSDTIKQKYDINQTLAQKAKILNEQLYHFKQKYYDNPTLINEILENEDQYSPAFIKLMWHLQNEIIYYDKLFRKEIKLRRNTERWLFKLDKKSDPVETFDTPNILNNFPEKLAKKVKLFDNSLNQYLKIKSQMPIVIYTLMQNSIFNADEIPFIRALLLEIYGEHSDLELQNFNSNSLVVKLIEANQNIKEIDTQLNKLYIENINLKKDYIEKVIFIFYEAKYKDMSFTDLLKEEENIDEIPVELINRSIQKGKKIQAGKATRILRETLETINPEIK